MNPSTRQARAVVAALAKHGVRHVVISPGSRNGALSIALAQAKDSIELHVRIDERSAAFTALGIAKRTNRPVAIVCTSGTAATHFGAAVFEAHEAGVPLIVITTDRPPSVRGRGANQTIMQVDMFDAATRDAWDLPIAADHDDLYWELAVAGAISVSLGDEFAASGPVHLNMPFAEPLVPDVDDDDSWASRIEIGELPLVEPGEDIELSLLLQDMKITSDRPRGVIIISDPNSAQSAINLAKFLRWPVLAEPGSMARNVEVGIQHYARLLADSEFVAAHQPDLIITAGRFGLARSVNGFVQNSTGHIAVGRYPLDADPFETAAHHLAKMPLPLGVLPADENWLNSWKSADADVDELDTDDFVSRNVVRCVLEQAGPRDLVWIAASMAVRYADDVATLRADAPMMLVNRGTNGIDGLIASAGGAALAHPQGRTFLIVGDVAFLHDLSSLAIPILENKPPLTIVVLNNRGGAIFKTLEQGDPRFENVFDRVYGTHHDFDITATAAALGYLAKNVDSIEDLKTELEQHPRVIVASLYNN